MQTLHLNGMNFVFKKTDSLETSHLGFSFPDDVFGFLQRTDDQMRPF